MRWGIPAFFDPHVHLRETGGALFTHSVCEIAEFCNVVCAMLNFAEPMDDPDILNYSEDARRIAGFCDRSLMVMPVPLLGDKTTPERINSWARLGVRSVKYMPRGATTNSHHGVTHPGILEQNGIFDCLSDLGMIMQVHCEMPPGPDGPTIAWALGAEREFVDTFCEIAVDHPNLKMIFEHISTREALRVIKPFVNVAATITPHHLTMTVDDVLYPTHRWVKYPHNWCRPIAKTPEDREALVEAACGNNKRIFFGSDYAPHRAQDKLQTPPPAGCANYPAAPYVLARFAAEHGLGAQWLSDFTSGRAAEFFGLIRNITPRVEIAFAEDGANWSIPAMIQLPGTQEGILIPWLAGERFDIAVSRIQR